MKITKTLPPNIELIRAALNPPHDALFCYGDTIYNPSGRNITPDLEVHEAVHSKQQGDNPDLWYMNYLTSPSFRLSQEIEAYGEQYAFARQHVRGKLLKWALENMAKALSGEAYGNLISLAEAESKIRNFTKLSSDL